MFIENKILKKGEILQIKLKTEQEIEKISQILNEKHLELLKLMFPGWFKKFENIKSKIFKNNVTRVQINFKWKIFNKYSRFEINLKVCEFYLLFSLKTNKILDDIFEKDFDSMMFASYLNSLGIRAELVSISKSNHPKNGVCGKKHSPPKHKSNGFGKLSRPLKGKSKLFTRKQKKKLKK